VFEIIILLVAYVSPTSRVPAKHYLVLFSLYFILQSLMSLQFASENATKKIMQTTLIL